MNDTLANQREEAVLADLNRILRTREFSAQQSYHLETELVAVFINPYPTDDHRLLHIPIYVRALTEEPTSLQHIPVFLDFSTPTSDAAASMLHYGRLNKRGAVCFSHVEVGTYHLLVPLRGSAPASGSVIALLPQHTALTPAAQSATSPTTPSPHFRRIFQSSNGAIRVVVLHRETGEYIVTFQALHQLWDGSIVRFLWHDHADPATPPETFLVVLTWNPRRQRCVAEVNVGRVAETFTISLPEEPEPLTMLESQAPDIIRRSILMAHTYQTRQAWQRILANQTLAAHVRQQIEQALQ